MIFPTEFSDVMMQPMVERSANTPYAKMAQDLANAVEKNLADGSPPSVIADVISKAIKAKRPKTRYAAGKLARTALTMRSVLTDRMFDYAVVNMTS